MTVSELIEELEAIEDKSKPVKTWDADYGDWLSAGFPSDFGDFVGV